MVSVGDSPDVHLFEVVGGGREFRPVAVYKGQPYRPRARNALTRSSRY